MTELNYKQVVDFRVTNIGAWAHQTALDLGNQISGLTFEEVSGNTIKNFDLSTSTVHESGTGDGIRCNLVINTENKLSKKDINSINSFFDSKNIGSVRSF